MRDLHYDQALDVDHDYALDERDADWDDETCEGDDCKPECQITGTDGNVFAIIGSVSRCLKRAGQSDRAKEWADEAMSADSYDAVLQLMFKYVSVR